MQIPFVIRFMTIEVQLSVIPEMYRELNDTNWKILAMLHSQKEKRCINQVLLHIYDSVYWTTSCPTTPD